VESLRLSPTNAPWADLPGFHHTRSTVRSGMRRLRIPLRLFALECPAPCSSSEYIRTDDCWSTHSVVDPGSWLAGTRKRCTLGHDDQHGFPPAALRSPSVPAWIRLLTISAGGTSGVFRRGDSEVIAARANAYRSCVDHAVGLLIGIGVSHRPSTLPPTTEQEYLTASGSLAALGSS